MPKPVKITAEDIYRVISKQNFTDWFNRGRWDAHLTDSNPSKQQILADITQIFNLDGSNTTGFWPQLPGDDD